MKGLVERIFRYAVRLVSPALKGGDLRRDLISKLCNGRRSKRNGSRIQRRGRPKGVQEILKEREALPVQGASVFKERS